MATGTTAYSWPYSTPYTGANDLVNGRNDPMKGINDPVNGRNDPTNGINDPVNGRNDPVSGRNDLESTRDDLASSSNINHPDFHRKQVKILIRGSDCASILRRGGPNLVTYKRDYNVHVEMIPCWNIGTVVTLTGKHEEECLDVIKEVICLAPKGPYTVDKPCALEVNLLLRMNIVGKLTSGGGKGGSGCGSRVDDIRQNTNSQIKVYSDVLANTQEGVIAIGCDNQMNIIEALRMMISLQCNQSKDTIQHKGSTIQHNGSRHSAPVPLMMPPPGMRDRPPGMRDQLPGLRDRPPGMRDQLPGLRDRPPGMRDQPPGMRDRPPGMWDQPSLGMWDQPRGMLHDRIGMVGNNNKHPTDHSWFPMQGFPQKPLHCKFLDIQTETKIHVTHEMCGAIIGKGGATIRETRNTSRAKITFETDDEKKERIITLSGTQSQVQMAEKLLTLSVKNSILDIKK